MFVSLMFHTTYHKLIIFKSKIVKGKLKIDIQY